jgi:exopolysaccharide biosynthesis polyprenyl glycosylphosphotransferase
VLNSATPFTHTPISTNRAIAWAPVSAVPRESDLKARSYWLPRTRAPFIAAELIVIAALLFRANGHPETLGLSILTTSCAVFFHINNLDTSIVTSESWCFAINALKSVAQGILGSVLVFCLVPPLAPSAALALTAAVLASLLPVGLRPILRCLVTREKLVEGIVIIGTGVLVGKLHQALVAREGRAKRKGVLQEGRLVDFPGSPTDRTLTVDIVQLNEILACARVSRVIVSDQDPRSRGQLAAALVDNRLRGLQVSDAADFYETLCGKIWVDGLSPQWPVFSDGFNRSKASLCLKCCFDVILALLLLIAAAPMLAVIAVAIKIDSAGPLFFRQVRVGLHGKTFVIYKFRSMRQDAEVETGPVWAVEQDPRVTTVGRLLRKFRLDEIPQLFNVLRGEMSLVGPRPERPYFVDQIERQIPLYGLRHYLKPGITGLAQVMHPYGGSIEDAHEKLQYEFYYAKHQSLLRDAEILLKTVKVVLCGWGR